MVLFLLIIQWISSGTPLSQNLLQQRKKVDFEVSGVRTFAENPKF
jgi:hypothetical protein